MSQENVEQLHRLNDALDRRDVDGVIAVSDPDVEFTPLLIQLEGGSPYRGHDGVRSWFADLFGAFPDYRATVDDVKDLGTWTVASVRARVRIPGSDDFTEQRFWHATEWRRGKCIWWRNYLTEAEALEAAGLLE